MSPATCCFLLIIGDNLEEQTGHAGFLALSPSAVLAAA